MGGGGGGGGGIIKTGISLSAAALKLVTDCKQQEFDFTLFFLIFFFFLLFLALDCRSRTNKWYLTQAGADYSF